MPGAAAAAVAAYQQRRRYDQIMCDREPKATDKVFMAELLARLDSYHLTGQRAKERQLADAEKRREWRLGQEGAAAAAAASVGLLSSLPRGRRSHSRRRRRRLQRPAAHDDGVSDDGEWNEFWPRNPDNMISERNKRQEMDGQCELSDDAKRLTQTLQSLPARHQMRPDGDCDSTGDATDDGDNRLSNGSTVDELYSWASDTLGRP